jgi:phosphatidylglycerol:prolipoprotein diacylglycerol transferase
MSKIAFSLGPLHFYWYGLIIAAAILAAFLITLVCARRSGEPLEPVVDLVLFGVPAGLAGARFSYVLADWALYWDNPLTVICLWQGGLSVQGALFAFLLVLFLYARQTGLFFWRWADLCAPGLAFAVALGQWANFFNQEAFGYPTDRPWGVYIDFALRPAGYEQFDFFHPVFMYESGWNAVLFLFLAALAFWRQKTGRPRAGTIFLLAALFFAAGHFVFTGLRLDYETLQGVFITRVVSGLLAAAALVLLLRPAGPGAGEESRER